VKEALLVIDMLNDFVLPGAPLEVPSARRIIAPLKARIARARKKGIPVMYLCDAHRKDDPEFIRMGWPPHAIAGSAGAQVVSELMPLPRDAVVRKRSYSGFFETSLERQLRCRGVIKLTVTGCVTNICVLYTAADAVQRGYGVTVYRNCVASLNARDHEFALRQMQEVLGARVV